MDVQQLRSWVFELYEPLTEDRTYIILRGRTGTLIDLPPFDWRAVLTIHGVCDPALVFFTHADRARDAARWREAFPALKFAIHEAEADRIEGGVEMPLADGDVLTRDPQTQVIHIGAHSPGASMVLASVPGGVLFAGDAVVSSASGTLSLPDPSYAPAEKVRAGIDKLRNYDFSAVLTAHGHPVWSAGKERYLQLLEELPRPDRRFGHIVDVPWDRAYLRVRSQMVMNPLVPREETIEEAAGHGPSTLVPAWEGRPVREVAWKESAPAPAAAAVRADGKRWSLATEAAKAMPARPTGAAQTLPWELLEAPVTFRRLTARELVEIPQVDLTRGSFDLSRDGADVVFSWDPTGNAEVYRAPLEGDAIYQLTAGDSRALQPRISPDGRWVAFLREAGGGADIWLVDRDGARERKITDQPASRGGLAWSPDGRALAYFSRESGAAALHRLDVASGASHVLAGDVRANDAGPSWSSDGSLIAYSAGDGSGNADLFVARADGSGTPRRIETRGAAAGLSLWPRFSPDDKSLAFVTDARGRWEVALVPASGGTVRLLREGHYDEFDPVWDVEPSRLLYLRNTDGVISARRAYLVSLEDEPVLDAPGVHAAVRARPNGDLVYQWTGAREPPDVFVKGKDEILPRRVTRSLPPSIPAGLFVEPRHVRYASTDGVSIPALLYLPHREAVDGGVERPPAVVYAHGGPALQHSVMFDEWAQWLANQGYVVLAPNVRGSVGYGRAFREATSGDIGGKDLEDLGAGAAWLVAEGVADAERIAVLGRSYGGYLALRAAERWPERFAATCSIAGRVTLETLVARLPSLAPADLGLLPERSVLEAVEALRAPVLLLYGERDPHIALSDIESLVESLRTRGNAFSFHVYPGAGHELTGREDRRDTLERVIEFFDEQVKKKVSSAA